MKKNAENCATQVVKLIVFTWATPKENLTIISDKSVLMWTQSKRKKQMIA